MIGNLPSADLVVTSKGPLISDLQLVSDKHLSLSIRCLSARGSELLTQKVYHHQQ